MKVKTFAKRNASTILTVLGGVGTIATSVMAVKATPKALKRIETVEEVKGEKLTITETIKVAGPVYIPAVIVGVGTLACIFGAHIFNKRQQAALMSAYVLLENSYKEYRKTVKETVGDEIYEEIDRAILEKATDENGDQLMLFHDEYTDQYFESTLYKVQQAQYLLNRDILVHDFAVLNDWCRYLGIDEVPYGNKLGWSTWQCMEMYWQPWVDFKFEDTELNGQKVKSIHIYESPVEEFYDDYY